MKRRTFKYDVFVSHAVEDKIAIATELEARLRNAGLKIWYSGRELIVGGSITDMIEEGLNQSRFGVVILSKNYLAKNWPIREFYTLLTREVKGQKVVLPVLYNITPKELADRDLDMADKMAIDASRGMDYIVETLVSEIRKQKKKTKQASQKRLILYGTMFLIALMIAGVTWYRFQPATVLTDSVVEKAVQERITTLDQQINHDLQLDLKNPQAKPVLLAAITGYYDTFKKYKSRYRNTYQFENGYIEIQHKRNVTSSLQIDVESLSPYNGYLLYSPSLYLLKDDQQDQHRRILYALVNSQPVGHTISNTQELSENVYAVTVAYTNNIRYVEVSLLYPNSASDTKHYAMELRGFFPSETYVFEQKHGNWSYTFRP